MFRKLVSIILPLLLVISALASAFNVQMVRASGTIYIRGDGSIDPPLAPIYTADNITYTLTGNITNSGDAILIERDNMTLDGAGYTIEGTGSGSGIFLDNRSNVTINNMKIETFSNGIFVRFSSGNNILGNSLTNNSNSGIDLAWSTNNSILGNYASNNTWGISLVYSANNSVERNNATSNSAIGIDLYDSTNNSVFWNNMTNDGDGISVSNGGSNNTLIGNNIANSDRYGILLGDSFNTLRNNSVANCRFNFAVWGSLNDVDATNTVNGKPVYYWINKHDMTVPPDAGYIALMDCTRITVKNQNLANNEEEVFLANTTDSVVTENNITINNFGVLLQNSTNNIISENTMTNGDGNTRIYFLDDSSNNQIFHNNFLGGTFIWIITCNNTFDDGYPSGGNYWSDYSGTDSNGDGIGDTPYVIDANNTDRYPLMAPYGTFDAGTWNGTACSVGVMSNSTVSAFQVDVAQKTIGFSVMGAEGSTGFCRVTIPNAIVQNLWDGNYTVMINDEPWPFENWTDATNTYVYINYMHSEHGVIIIPEYSLVIVLTFLTALSTLPIALWKKRASRKLKT